LSAQLAALQQMVPLQM
jgi:hypothetical protein